MTQERRRSKRTSVRVKVQFGAEGGGEGVTINASKHGIFVETNQEFPVDQHLPFKIFLPPDQRNIDVFGRIARIVDLGQKKGYGIEFNEMPSQHRETWVEFILTIESLSQRTPIPGPPPKEPSPKAPPSEDERRQTHRTSASFMVRFRSKQRLEEFVSQNISEGGMFLATPVLKVLGEQVQVVLIHPENDSDFEIAAEVIRVNGEPTEKEPKGMALAFKNLTDEKKDLLKDFLVS